MTENLFPSKPIGSIPKTFSAKPLPAVSIRTTVSYVEQNRSTTKKRKAAPARVTLGDVMGTQLSSVRTQEQIFQDEFNNARKALANMRWLARFGDITSDLESFQKGLGQLADLNPNRNEERSIVDQLGTSMNELDQLFIESYQNVRVTPDLEHPTEPRRDYGKRGRSDRLYSFHDRRTHVVYLAKRVRDRVEVQMPVLSEILPYIVYPKGMRYGSVAYIQFPDDRHAFQYEVEASNGSVSEHMLMAKGMMACAKHEECRWIYRPVLKTMRKLEVRLVGNFREGFRDCEDVSSELICSSDDQLSDLVDYILDVMEHVETNVPEAYA